MQMQGYDTLNLDAIYIPSEVAVTEYKTLTRTVSAILLEKDQTRGARLGALKQLKAGTQVGICGPGFSARTVKIQTDDHEFYFVFLEDVNAPTL